MDAEVNELTVIANDSYENFSRVLQEDFNQSMNFNKNEVTSDILTVTLEKAGVQKEKITAELVDTFKQELMRKGVFDSNNILINNVAQTTKLLAEIVFGNEILKEHTIKLKGNFAELMVQKGSHRIEIKNLDNEPYVNTVRAFVSQEEFQQIYFGLSSNLTKRILYKCNVDKNRFMFNCIEEINLFAIFQN